MPTSKNPENPVGSVKVTDQEALDFHKAGRPGKVALQPTKSLSTQRDLSLAYSPGVAAPCKEIHRDPDTVYDYTAKGNTVAVISNGTAVLGLGNLGALASKPVMEGKSVLFKKFADIDGVDLEVDTENVEEFINCVKYLAPSFGGINLEDIGGPECFIIEKRLQEEMDIPVFHDDQHGTAIISSAGLLNALDISGKNIKDIKLVVNGAGAAGLACAALFRKMGVPHDQVLVCDRTGVIYKGRNESMNEWKEAHAVTSSDRTLEDACKGADMLVGLSVAGAFSEKMVKSMAKSPVIFAMANPVPEISPEVVKKIRPDAIMATGRSDYPNQVNNVLGFPYIFRGALDVRATKINEEMKIAAAEALAKLAREDVPDEVAAAYAGKRLQYGPDYIIPVPFDPRLISSIPPAVAEAAAKTGVAKKPIESMSAYKHALNVRRDPTVSHLEIFFEQVRANPKRVVFAEGEQRRTIRAALAFKNEGYGEPILVGREQVIADRINELGLDAARELRVVNAANTKKRSAYADMLYDRVKREGVLYRDAKRLVNTNRNVFAACMVKMGDADAVVTGLTRNYFSALKDIDRVFDRKCMTTDKPLLFGLNIAITRGRTVFIADTTINELPTAEQLVHIAIRSAEKARKLGHEPRVGLLSFANFGYPMWERNERIRDAVKILDSMKVDFEYEGEMSPEIALDHDFMTELYPFSRLTGPANILVMPGLHAAAISSKLLQQLGVDTMIGPLLLGYESPVQIAQMAATAGDLTTLAAFAAHEAIQYPKGKTGKTAKKAPAKKKKATKKKAA